MTKDTNLNIRSVPGELARKVKSAAALKGQTIREFVIEALQEKLKSRLGPRGERSTERTIGEAIGRGSDGIRIQCRERARDVYA